MPVYFLSQVLGILYLKEVFFSHFIVFSSLGEAGKVRVIR